MAGPQQQGASRNADGTFRKGFSGNPGGAIKGAVSMKRLLKNRLREHPDLADEVIAKVEELAIAGERWAVELIFSYIDGKPHQSVEVIERVYDPVASAAARDEEVAEAIDDVIDRIARANEPGGDGARG